MASGPTLIFCSGSSKQFTAIALDAGFQYGARLPSTTHAPLYFADQDWKRPNRAVYMRALEKERPTMATVLDWEEEQQLPEVLDWAEEASQFVRQVVVIPKVTSIDKLPRIIGGATVVLGYSVPTKFGGTSVPVWAFEGWPVHLLGGSPQAQMALTCYLNVTSVDGNMHQRMATSRCCYWTDEKSRYGHWQPLHRAVEHDAPYEAFRRSCGNIIAAWQERTR